MAKSNKITKFEIEDASGALTDITSFVDSAKWTIKEHQVDFWKHPVLWIREWIRARRIKKVYVSGQVNIELDVEFVRKIKEPWRWN